jgi:hypothetical protein
VEWKFKKDLEPCGSGDTWYDLTDGGYIEPKDILQDKDQLEILQNAIHTVRSFIWALEDADLLNEF